MSKLHKFVAVIVLFLYLVGCGGSGGVLGEQDSQSTIRDCSVFKIKSP